MLAMLLAGVMAVTPRAGADMLEATDTFEIVLPRFMPSELDSPVLVQADRLLLPPQSGLAELRAEDAVVALFQVHQVLLVANRSLRGSRRFTVETAQGSYTIFADRMRAERNNLVLFWVGEELTAIVQPSQVQLITDDAARVRRAR